MIKPDTIIASAAFVLFAFVNVAALLFFARNLKHISTYFCALLTCSFTLWAIHGGLVKDIALGFGCGFAAFTSGITFCMKMFYKSKEI